MPKKRVYTDKEISVVLKRAAELQRAQGPADPSGLSLSELEQIAAEVGIDPDFVKAAAEELEARRAEKTYHVLGGPSSIDLERIVEGEMTDEKWEEAVGEIRRIFGAAGKTAKHASSWTVSMISSASRRPLRRSRRNASPPRKPLALMPRCSPTKPRPKTLRPSGRKTETGKGSGPDDCMQRANGHK